MYQREKTFKKCKDKQLLIFDFYLPEHKILIEFQGQQHYEPIEMWGGKEALKGVQRRDKIKRRFAKSEGFKLIEVKYDVKDVEEYLTSKLITRV